MKKTIILSILLILSAGAIKAQSPILDNPDNRPYWGIRVAWDYSLPGKWNFDNGNSAKIYKPGSGFTLGAVYNLPVVANLYFEPGVTFYYNTYSYDDLILSEGDYEETDPKIEKFGFRVPLNFGYRFDFFENGGFSVFTGPELCIGASSRVETKHFDEVGIDYNKNLYGKSGYMRRFNLAWSAGLAFHFASWQINVSAAFGLLDLHKKDAKFHENRLNVGLGYNF